jgi:hypothetical protein
MPKHYEMHGEGIDYSTKSARPKRDLEGVCHQGGSRDFYGLREPMRRPRSRAGTTATTKPHRGDGHANSTAARPSPGCFRAPARLAAYTHAIYTYDTNANTTGDS